MKKRLKTMVSLALCAILCFGLSSCENKENNNTIDDSYLEGLERGEKNIFVSLYKATSRQAEILKYDDVWETDHFILSFRDFETSDSSFLECDLTLKGTTIDEALEKEYIYFGLYSHPSSNTWNTIVADYEDYYMWAILEDDYNWGDYTSRTTFEIYDNQRTVVAIIAIQGNIYTAGYLLNTNY